MRVCEFGWVVLVIILVWMWSDGLAFGVEGVWMGWMGWMVGWMADWLDGLGWIGLD